jgi:putative phage-type endonuclease
MADTVPSDETVKPFKEDIEKMTSTQPMDRTRGLGGSDMAAILGIDRFRTPLDVYLEKIGEAPPREQTEAMRWGILLEDDIAAEWARRKGVKVRRRNQPVVHPEHPWMVGHIDRLVEGKNEGLEVKLASVGDWGEDDTDEIPPYYLPQPHHYMTAKRADRWHVAALLVKWGPPQLHSYTIERDDEMSGILIEAGEKFLRDHVEPRVPPDPTSSEQASLLWRQAVTGKHVLANEDTLRVIRDLEEVKAAQKSLAEDRDRMELLLKAHLQDAEACVDEANKSLLTWKEQTSNRFDTARFKEEHPEDHAAYMKASTYRVLRILKHGKEAAK